MNASAAALPAIPEPSPKASLDAQIQRVKAQSAKWAKLPVAEKRHFLRKMREGYREISLASVDAACAAKGIPEGHLLRGEEWLGGPVVTLRALRLLEQSLHDIEKYGAPRISKDQLSRLPDGRLAVKVYPLGTLESSLLLGTELDAHLEAGITLENLAEHQASFYRRPSHSGRVCGVLGAGNVNAIAPVDCLQKLFSEGMVCILKMNPVNAYLGPFVERAFRSLIDAGYLAVVYGGAEEGSHLVNHPDVDEIHMTGSDKTYDLLVWGPPGPERDRRRAQNDPLLKKPLSAELGNISPVIIVPGPYSAADLAYQGRSIAGMVSQNASFNCVSAKLLVLPNGAPFRSPFLDALEAGLRQVPPRKAWYPGAESRWKSLTLDRPNLRVIGAAEPGSLPWAIIPGVDAQHPEDRVFREEPWCAVVSETQVGRPGQNLREFLEDAVAFVNTQLWGTLCATLIVHPETWAAPSSRADVEAAIRALRYGSVAVNSWPGAVFGLGTPPWGAHPSSTPLNIQSGLGHNHNTLMLEGVEKVVVRAPFKPLVRPPWWPGHRSLETLGRRLADFEDEPSWLKLPALSAAAALG